MKKFVIFFTACICITSMLFGCTININSSDNFEFPTELQTQKIGELDLRSYNYSVVENGIIYQNNDGKYGVISSDGKNDTGAIYTFCESLQGFFAFSTANISVDPNNVHSMNQLGIIDNKGNVIVPEQYCSFSILNSRYIKAIAVTETTDTNDENAVVFDSSDDSLQIFPDSDDQLYKGVWHIYDAETGMPIENATGTKAYVPDAYGDILSYVTDDQVRITVHPSGEPLPNNSTVYMNGSYSVSNGQTAVVYDSQGDRLFDYNPNNLTISSYNNGYYIASEYIDDVRYYSVLNENGEKVSIDFADYISVYGDMVLCADDTLRKLDGSLVVPETVDSVEQNEFMPNVYLVEQDSDYIVVDYAGNIIFEIHDEEDVYFSNFYLVSEKSNENYDSYCYSLIDMDYTIYGDRFSYFTAQAENADGYNSIYDIVDTISGKTLIEGYSNYLDSEPIDNAYYVYAINADGLIDIYVISY